MQVPSHTHSLSSSLVGSLCLVADVLTFIPKTSVFFPMFCYKTINTPVLVNLKNNLMPDHEQNVDWIIQLKIWAKIEVWIEPWSKENCHTINCDITILMPQVRSGKVPAIVWNVKHFNMVLSQHVWSITALKWLERSMSPHAGSIRKDRLGHVKSTQWIKVFDSSQDRILFFAKTE